MSAKDRGQEEEDPSLEEARSPISELAAADHYWLVEYFTKSGKDPRLGLALMAVKFPGHLTKEAVKQKGTEIQKGDKFAVRGMPVTVTKKPGTGTDDVISLFWDGERAIH